MFSGAGPWGGFGSAEDFINKERGPPPRPIPLEFPNYTPPRNDRPLTLLRSRQLRNIICNVKQPGDLTDEHLSHLNIHLDQDVPLHQFVPAGYFEERPLPHDSDLTSMLAELETENEVAFREVLRLAPASAETRPRIAYSRNFFASLEDMSRYWDDSQDQYYRIPDLSRKGPDVNEPKSDAKMPHSENLDKTHMTNESNNGEMTGPMAPDSASSASTKEVYKGRRIGNGEQLGAGTRVGAAKSLLKMVIYKFNCRDHEPMPSPREKLVIMGVKIPAVQYHFCVARTASDAKMARARMVEGPIMAVHSRDEVRFKSREGLLDARSDFTGERFDLFREVGCMLILARQRARQGKDKQDHTSANSWWTNKERWGGGPTKWGSLACEVYEDEDPSWSPEERQLQEAQRLRGEKEEQSMGISKESDVKALSVEDLMAQSGRPKKKPRGRAIPRPAPDDPSLIRDGRRVAYTPPYRRKWYDDWQRLRPNQCSWDEKIISKQIGIEGNGDVDQVFMLSSVNHHICLMRLQVHRQYLDWLEDGRPGRSQKNASDDDEKKPNILLVSRSKWVDLFKVDERKELLVALWRLMCWLNREELGHGACEK